ncbi:hypothetical protein PN441_05160 [Spirulina major CS-329]|nr:hypothetical protein [Spirulina major]MDB9496274.1 hypothetical protein [Spirulina subsalsa CS-330]MDB9502453.1 hypothetical protein [Spirulina major CS-329]
MDLDPKLVQRLTRPIHQPGVTNHRMADRLIDRAERLVNRLPLLDQQLARWSAIADLETEDIPIVYAQVNEADQSAADDGPQAQPQRVQGKDQTDTGEGDLPIAVATPMQPSIPPDLSRVEPSQAPQRGTDTGNLGNLTPPLPPNPETLPTAQDQGKLSQSSPAPDRGSVPPESITAPVSPQAIAPEPPPHSPTLGPMPVVESFPPSDSSAPMGEAIAPLGSPTSQTTDVIQAKLETGATQVQPLDVGADRNTIAPVQATESLPSATVSPIDPPETSTTQNPAFDPKVMQAALSLDHPNSAPSRGDLPLAQMPPAISDNEPMRSGLERQSVPKISKSKAHRSPKKSPRQAPSPAQSSPPEVLTALLSPDPASPASKSMPLVQPSASSEPSAMQGKKQARVKGDPVRSPASLEPSAPMGGAIASLGSPTSQTTDVIQAKLETGSPQVQPLDVVGADRNNIAPAPVAESLQAPTVSPIDPPETSIRKNPAFDPKVMQAALSLDHPEPALTQVLAVSNESGVKALSLDHPKPDLTGDTLPLAQMPTAISDNEPEHSKLERQSVPKISKKGARSPKKSPRQAPSPAQSSPPEALTTPLSPDPASPASESMPLVQPSASSEPSAPMGGAIAPLGTPTSQTRDVIQAKLETGVTQVQPLDVGADRNTIAPVQATESLSSATVSPIDPPETSTTQNPAFDPKVMQAALSLDHPNSAPSRGDLPLAQMPPAISDNEPGRSGLERQSVPKISKKGARSPKKSPRQAPSPAQSAPPEALTTPLSPDSASPASESMPLVQPSASSEPSAPMGGAIADIRPSVRNTSTGIDTPTEKGKRAIQALNVGEAQSTPSLHPPNTPDSQPQTAALPTIQTHASTEGIIQAKFATGAAVPVIAPSEGSGIGPNPSGFTPLNFAASNAIADPLTTGPVGMTSPDLPPPTALLLPAVTAVPPSASTPPLHRLFNPLNALTSLGSELPTPPKALETVVPLGGGDRRYPQDQPIFLGLNRLEGDQSDGAKPSGAIAVPNRATISPQALATPSEQGQDFTFVLPNESETAKMPQTAATPKVQTSRDANHPGSRAQAVEISQPIPPLVNAEIGRNTSPELVVTTSLAANPTAASATPALPRAIAQPLPPQTNPASNEQQGLELLSRHVERSSNTPTAQGITAQAQPSKAASPQREQASPKITNKSKRIPQPVVRPQGQKPQKVATQGLTSPISPGQKTAVLPLQPSETRSRYPSGRPTPTPQPQIIGNPQSNPTVTATPPMAPLPTVQAQTEFNPQNLEPLVLSRPLVRSHRTAVSQEIHAQPRSQTPSSPVVVSPALPNPPPAIASPGQQSSSTAGQRLKSTTPQVAKQTTPAAVNIDDLVAKVERKVLKRLVVERERRGGQRQWR